MAGLHTRKLTFLVCYVSVLFSGCNTKAVAVEQCREIEHARCEFSVPCGIIDSAAVEECQRTYTDQCLHGIAGPKAPSSSEQDACLSLLDEAHKDAQESEPGDDSHESACAIIGKPWESPQCDFLNPAMGGAGGAEDDDEDE